MNSEILVGTEKEFNNLTKLLFLWKWSFQHFDNSTFYKKLSKHKQICRHLRLLGGNETKVANAKSYMCKTKYGKMAMINYEIILICTWLAEQK